MSKKLKNLTEIQEFHADFYKSVRLRILNSRKKPISQSDFALLFGLSLPSVRKWDQGLRVPGKAVKRLYNIIKINLDSDPIKTESFLCDILILSHFESYTNKKAREKINKLSQNFLQKETHKVFLQRLENFSRNHFYI